MREANTDDRPRISNSEKIDARIKRLHDDVFGKFKEHAIRNSTRAARSRNLPLETNYPNPRPPKWLKTLRDHLRTQKTICSTAKTGIPGNNISDTIDAQISAFHRRINPKNPASTIIGYSIAQWTDLIGRISSQTKSIWYALARERGKDFDRRKNFEERMLGLRE